MKITDDMLTEWFAAHPSLLDDRAVFSARQVRTIVREAVAARRTTPDREEIIEECAKVCEEYAADQWSLYKGRAPYTGSEQGRADPDVQGRSDGADVCAERIRSLKTAPTSDKGGA
ncbi:hypothetical protein C6Q15_28225 [Burkholderia multivorans]|uniref:Uncharacterized protein n=1 Tax=Burkholderia multivorans TaxID=87883 RepID=A0A2S9MBE7_9BURK|nr:hypothetical protein [Burkholderia multivorans]PRF54654.1 hypothetical protein C6Q15_28225 [Burkholderia multivorans]